MDPNPYAVTEPELLRSLTLSRRGGFLRDHPESRLSLGPLASLCGSGWFPPGPTPGQSPRSQPLRLSPSAILGLLHVRGSWTRLVPTPTPLRHPRRLLQDRL